MSSAAVNLYAEFLLNIRQVTLYATLQNKRAEESRAFVSSDRKSISVTHEGETSSIVYPSGISGKAVVHIPISQGKIVSLRLEITEDGAPHGDGMEVANDSPWPASSLSSETELACRCCQALIVPARCREWQNLPREDWADMMDLWHCHKPSMGKDHVSAQGVYEAIKKPTLRSGIGFVDTGHIAVPESECSGIKIQVAQIHCSQCSSQIGVLDNDLQGIRLYKWNILVRRLQNGHWERNDVQNFICAQLLQTIDSQASRKFVAFAGDISESQKGVLLWVFNPDLKYSASYINSGKPRRAMKILFRIIEKPMEAVRNTSVEELPLPPAILPQLERSLLSSNNLIPERAQVLQDWKVGLLDRFDPNT